MGAWCVLRILGPNLGTVGAWHLLRILGRTKHQWVLGIPGRFKKLNINGCLVLVFDPWTESSISGFLVHAQNLQADIRRCFVFVLDLSAGLSMKGCLVFAHDPSACSGSRSTLEISSAIQTEPSS